MIDNMKTYSARIGAVLLSVVLVAAPMRTFAGTDTPMPVAALAKKTHFHGIAVDAKDPSRVYLATHHGFYVVAPDGTATRISDNRNDYMGFTPHPTDPDVFFASGHPATGGNTGFLQSTDGGRTWRQLAMGVRGPVDFHQMAISRSDPRIIYGVYGGLQVSRDGGRTWEMRGNVPPKLFDLAVSATDPNRLYAATQGGLLVSTNGGGSWQPAHYNISPSSMVQTTAKGDVYAFIAGLGLLRSPDGSLRWNFVSKDFGDRYLLHLAVDPSNADLLYVVTNKGELLKSTDGGGAWRPVGAN
jgi:photosystem II stability/assembly factor-like uncharacterized protein